ncbi:MAG TPA: energy transducer TonB [Candidatus Angelobacter sp.]|nr:energy transducer TonB [Candidatus Angelobacter sp.]
MSSLDPKQPNASSGGTSAAAQPSQTVVKFEKGQGVEPDLPTLFGKGYGTYQARPENYVLSFVSHTAVIGLVLWVFHVTIQPQILTPTIGQSIDLSDYVMKVGKGGPSGGGGGDASKLKASTGVPPKSAKQQFAPPVVLQEQKSKLMVEPTVIADLKVPQGQIGDPLSKLMALSNGSGVGGGIGSGDGGGVGSGHGGPGVGPGVFHLGESGVSAPRILYQPEPEFSEEARKAKYQGVVGLNVVVGPDGRIHNAQVVHSLGMGLDEKAIEGVKLWKFDPARKDGRPVAVAVYIEVDFHLY